LSKGGASFAENYNDMKNTNKKADVKKTLQIHSQAKVEFYKEYLVRYLRILSLSPFIRQINIYDVFCGMGVYKDGGKGSPIAAFEAIKNFREDPLSSKGQCLIKLVVNDKDKQNVENTESYISKHNNGFCQLETHNKDIDEMFSYVSAKVSESTSIERNLVFIDPYGYSKIKREILEQIMRNGRTEIILFLPISFMKRFTNAAVTDENNVVQYEPLRAFIDSFFPDNHPIRGENIGVHDYIRYISDALKLGKDFFTTSYYIERNVSTFFALFFISPHIYGFEKILEVKWALDASHGGGFNLPEDMDNLFKEDFIKEDRLYNYNVLRALLLDYLKQSRTNREVYKFVLRNEFLPKHANNVIKDMHSQGLLSLVTNDGKPVRKGAYHINHDAYKGKLQQTITFKLAN
jgi:three-Cys-motif partner protein